MSPVYAAPSRKRDSIWGHFTYSTGSKAKAKAKADAVCKYCQGPPIQSGQPNRNLLLHLVEQCAHVPVDVRQQLRKERSGHLQAAWFLKNSCVRMVPESDGVVGPTSATSGVLADEGHHASPSVATARQPRVASKRKASSLEAPRVEKRQRQRQRQAAPSTTCEEEDEAEDEERSLSLAEEDKDEELPILLANPSDDEDEECKRDDDDDDVVAAAIGVHAHSPALASEPLASDVVSAADEEAQAQPEDNPDADVNRTAHKLLGLLKTPDFDATVLVGFLTLHELGHLSATTKRLRYRNRAVGDAFYATCIVRVPTTTDAAAGDGAHDTFVQRMPERVAHLVTRVRIKDPSCLAHAICFANAREIDFVKQTWTKQPKTLRRPFGKVETFHEKLTWGPSTIQQLLRFSCLETLTMRTANVFDPSFLAHLPTLRQLTLVDKRGFMDVSLLPPLAHLEHLAIDVGHEHSTQFADGLVNLPVWPRLKSLELRSTAIRSLQGLERLDTIERLSLACPRAQAHESDARQRRRRRCTQRDRTRARPCAACAPPEAAGIAHRKGARSRLARGWDVAAAARVGV